MNKNNSQLSALVGWSIYPKSIFCGTGMGFETREENMPDDCFYKIKWKQLNVVNIFTNV